MKEFFRREVKPTTKQELIDGIVRFWETVTNATSTLIHWGSNWILREIFVLKIFRVKNFRRNDPFPCTLTVKCACFVWLIFVDKDNYENILTTKISRFTVIIICCIHLMYMFAFTILIITRV